MIPSWLVARIENLLQTASPYRAIARNLGISRETVRRVARGQWPGYARHTFPTKSDPRATLQQPRRCPICGALVIMPCQACATRAWIRHMQEAEHLSRNNPQPAKSDDSPLCMMLRPRERERYENLYLARKTRRRGTFL